MEKAAPDFDDIAQIPFALGELHQGNLNAALNAFALRNALLYRRPVKAAFHADNDICGFGATLWLLGDRIGAAQVWANVCDAAYRRQIHYSSYGAFQSPLLLWFASVWLKGEDWRNDAEQTLARLLGRRKPIMGSKFPAQLAHILRKETTLSNIKVARLAETPPLVRKLSGHLSEHEEIMALFYEGVSACEDGDTTKAFDLWSQVPSLKNEGPLEYYLLIHERKNLSTRGQKRTRRTKK